MAYRHFVIRLQHGRGWQPMFARFSSSVGTTRLAAAGNDRTTREGREYKFDYEGEKAALKKELPNMFNLLVEKYCAQLPEATEHLKVELYDELFPFVQIERGMRMLEMFTISVNRDKITQKWLETARTMALCNEMITSSFFILDDLLDKRESRMGHPTFHLQFPETVVLDGILLAHMTHKVISDVLRHRVQVREAILELFQRTAVRTTVGLIEDRLLRVKCEKDPAAALMSFGMDRYLSTVRNKIGYMAFVLPIGCGLLLAGKDYAKPIQRAMLDLGTLLQTEADMRDTGLWGEAVNIHQGWISWPIVVAKYLANPRQTKVLADNYGRGKDDQDAENAVKRIFKELEIESRYTAFRDQLVESIAENIRKSNITESKKVFLLSMTDEVIAGKFFRPQ